jgi:hypothetical protein
MGLLFVSVGCSTPKGTTTRQEEPSEQAVDESRQRVGRSLDRAFKASEDADSYTVLARHNPCRCDGPDFEIRAHGKWTRVYLEGKSEQTEAVADFVEREEEWRLLEIEGRFSGKRRAETGLKYRVFDVDVVAGQARQN